MEDQVTVKHLLKKNRITQWELADALGMNKYTLCRKLKSELNHDADFCMKVLEAIQRIKSKPIIQ